MILQGQLLPLSAVVDERRKVNPTIKLAYYEFVESPEAGKPQNFTVKMLHDLRFAPGAVSVENASKPDGAEASQTSVATLLPLQVWNSNFVISLS